MNRGFSAICLRLCRLFLAAFPREFRNAYGDDLSRLTEDAIQPIRREYGGLGLLKLLFDVAVRIPAEYLA